MVSCAAVPGRRARRAARRQAGGCAGPQGKSAGLRRIVPGRRPGLRVAPNFEVMLVARIVLGLGVGAAAATCPLFLAEMAPAHRRGRMVTINELMIVTGQMLAFIMNAVLDQLIHDPHVWRWMLARRRRPGRRAAGRHVVPAGFPPLVRRPRPARRDPARAEPEPRRGRGHRGVHHHRRARQAGHATRTRAPRCAT